MPMTVAVAGSSETINEYVARLNRAIASWSNTYGTPTTRLRHPRPAASATGSDERRQRARTADRRDRDERDEHGGAEPVDPVERGVPRDAVRKHDVQREQCSVRERERDADRLALEHHVGEQVDAEGRERERGAVAQRARADRGEADHGQELDRRDRSER